MSILEYSPIRHAAIRQVSCVSCEMPGVGGLVFRNRVMHTPARVGLRYGVAVLSVTVATILTFVVPWLRQRESFILLIGAVALSAWFGGRGPGLLSCLLAAFLQNYLIFEPVYEFSFAPEAIIPMSFFLIVALMISYLTNTLVEAGEKAREQRRLSDVTLSSIGDAVISTDAAGHVTMMNAVAQALTGWSTAEGAGKLCSQILRIKPPESAASPHTPIEQVLRENVTVHTATETVIVSRDGKRIPIEGNAAPIKSAQNVLQGVVFVFRDVTEREEARTKILDYQQRLRSAAAEVSLAEERERHVIAIGLHDRVGVSLGLTRIKLGTLRGQFSDGEIIKQFDDITQLMKQIIAEIRSLTFELSPPILYEFGLEPALDWLAGNMQAQHQLKCTFETHGEARALQQECNVLLFQGARELLVNVVKHAHAKHAELQLIKEDHCVRVKVRDDGVGFDASQAMLTPEKTLGFGLFSVRERINLLGGTFAIESQQGHGTCVTLTLPVAV